MPDALDACRLVHSLEHLTIGGGFLEIRELMDFGKALAWFGRDIYRTQKVRAPLLIKSKCTVSGSSPEMARCSLRCRLVQEIRRLFSSAFVA